METINKITETIANYSTLRNALLIIVHLSIIIPVVLFVKSKHWQKFINKLSSMLEEKGKNAWSTTRYKSFISITIAVVVPWYLYMVLCIINMKLIDVPSSLIAFVSIYLGSAMWLKYKQKQIENDGKKE